MSIFNNIVEHEILRLPGSKEARNEAIKEQQQATDKNGHKIPFARKRDGFDGDCPLCECEACKNRRYQDKSGDGTVSFQAPTKMSPDEAAHMVRAHEQEHVRNEQQRAKENNMEVVSQSVRIIYGTCHECGKSYVAGGETRTVTKYVNPDYIDLFRVGAEDITRKKGSIYNASA
ncbi:MAG: hypothetical protein FWD34_06610 [Oscillospiraceae bacterium]|nr:hypothetical protein [Oscillospiraceae bacterium]